MVVAQDAGDTASAAEVEAATVPADRLVSNYTDLAGSEANAQALIDGLRNGTAITLATPTSTTTTNADGTTTTTTSIVNTVFTPATGKLCWGEVNISLSLAQALVGTDATAEQLLAALNGGTLTHADGTTTTLAGVLQLRADGAGWGQIAKQSGFKLGALMSASKSGHTKDATAKADTAKAEHSKADVAKAEHSKPDHAVTRVEHPVRPERPARPERPERPDRPEHAGRPGG